MLRVSLGRPWIDCGRTVAPGSLLLQLHAQLLVDPMPNFQCVWVPGGCHRGHFLNGHVLVILSSEESPFPLTSKDTTVSGNEKTQLIGPGTYVFWQITTFTKILPILWQELAQANQFLRGRNNNNFTESHVSLTKVRD